MSPFRFLTATWLSIVLALLALLATQQGAEASDQTYTLPFAGQYSVTCPYQWYRDPPCNYDSPNFHYGVDFALGTQGIGGHPVLAAARGTALPCAEDPYAGYSVVIDHSGGRVTRYLHFDNLALPVPGQVVARGQTIGYEGSNGIGVTGPHLHYETREGASRICSSNNGSAVDPYGGQYSPGTYSWKTNPPSTARDLDFSGDGYSDLLGRETGSSGVLCLVRGNGAGGWIPNPDPGCNDGSPIGWEWDNFDYIFRPGDWNHDGKDDVMGRIPGDAGQLCLVAGNGSGGWIPNPDPACWDGTLIGSDWDFFDQIIGPGDLSGDGFNDILGRKQNGDLCLLRGNGYGGWIPYTWTPTCHDGNYVGNSSYNVMLTPSDWAGNGDSCPDVVARQPSSPYYMKYRSGNCNGGLGGDVNIEPGWSVYDWLLSVGDFSGDICSDILVRGGGGYLWMRKSTCNGAVTGGFTTIGYGWNIYTWIF